MSTADALQKVVEALQHAYPSATDQEIEQIVNMLLTNVAKNIAEGNYVGSISVADGTVRMWQVENSSEYPEINEEYY